MLVSPTLLLWAVQSALQLGRSFRQARDDAARARAFAELAPPGGLVELEEILKQIAREHEPIRARYPDLYGADGDFLLDVEEAHPTLLRDAMADALEYYLRARKAVTADGAALADLTAGIMIQPLVDPAAAKLRRTRFALSLLDIAFDAIAAQPSVLGLKPRAEAAVLGVVANVSKFLPGPDEEIQPDAMLNFGERAARVVCAATLQTLADRPDVAVRSEHVARLVGAAARPLAAMVADRDQDFTIERLSRVLRGPVAHAALTSFRASEADFLGARSAQSSAAGAILDGLLGAVLESPSDQFDVARAFTQDGLGLLFKGALTAAESRPELFLDEAGPRSDAARDLLKRTAGLMRAAPAPFSFDRRLGHQLALVAVDVAVQHAPVLSAERQPGSWRSAGVDVLQHVLAGFSQAVQAGAANPFTTLFTQTEAIEAVRIVAAHVAKTPGMLAGEDGSSEAQRLAAAVASFLANPATRLASGADWLRIVAVACEEATRNPDTLVAEVDIAGVRSPLLAALASIFLRTAAANFSAPVAGEAAALAPARQRGALLFGDTLRTTFEATLRAAANNAETLLSGEAHLTAVEKFLRTLQSYAARSNGRIGASEFVWLYRYWIAHVIDQGAASELTDADFETALKIAPSKREDR